MKKLQIILFCILISNFCFSQCPVKGDSKRIKLQHLDSLKNRANNSSNVDRSISIVNIFTHGNDINRFSSNQYVSITGIIKKVKYGGAETCECHSKDKNDYDYHIEIIPDGIDSMLPMICEITRFNRCISYDSLKTLVGKRVFIEGWLFWDAEHWQNSKNSNPNGTNLWRQTAWEIHPVMKIQYVR